MDRSAEEDRFHFDYLVSQSLFLLTSSQLFVYIYVHFSFVFYQEEFYFSLENTIFFFVCRDIAFLPIWLFMSVEVIIKMPYINKNVLLLRRKVATLLDRC